MRAFRNALFTLRTGFSIRISALRHFSSTPASCINYKSLSELRQLIEEKRCIVVSGTSYLDTDDIIRFKFGRYGEIEDLVRPSILDPSIKDRYSPFPATFRHSETFGFTDRYLYVVFSKSETAAEVLRVAEKTPFQYAGHLYTVKPLAKYEALHLNVMAVGAEGTEQSVSHDTFRLHGIPTQYGPEDVAREISSYGSLLCVKSYNGRKNDKPFDVKFADLQSSRNLQRQTDNVGAIRLDGCLAGILPTRTLVTPTSSIYMLAWVLCDEAYFLANVSRLASEIQQYVNQLSTLNGLPAPKFDLPSRALPYLLPRANSFTFQCFPYFRILMAYDSIDLARRAKHVFTSHSRSRSGWVLDAEYRRNRFDSWWSMDEFEFDQVDHTPKAKQTSLRVPGRKNWGSPG